MTTLQFSLFLVGLLVCYGLVHVRLLKFEAHMRQLEGFGELNRQLRELARGLNPDSDHKLARAIDELRPASLRANVEQTCNEVQALRETAEVVSRQIEQVQDQLGEMTVPGGGDGVLVPRPGDNPAAHARELLETRLLALGYARPRILTDLASLDFREEVEITVECEKNQLPFKGKVVISNGSVLDVQMQSAAQAFP